MKKLMYGGFGIALAVLLVIGVAAKPNGITHLTSLWVGDSTDTADVTPGNNDVFVSGTLEVDGAVRIDGTIDANGLVSPTTRGFIPLPLAGATVDSSNDIDDATAPNITIADSIPAAVWDNSGETTGIMWTIPVPPDYSSGLRLVGLVSSGTASGTPSLDWRLWFNLDNTAFDAAAIEQTGEASSLSSVNTSNDVLTMTINPAGAAAMASGTFVTVEVFNANTHASANTELKGLYLDYIRAM